MEYCLDTSVYIQAHRTYYAFDIAPRFWLALEKLANDGLIVSPVAVYHEIMQGKDELAKWAKPLSSILFVEPELAVNQSFQQIADFCVEKYRDEHWVRLFLSGADPWVIAQARANDLIVVAMEKNKTIEEMDKNNQKYKGRIKIPNMCSHFGIKCISTFDLLRVLKIGI